MIGSFRIVCTMLVLGIPPPGVSADVDEDTLRKAKNQEYFSLPYDEDERLIKFVIAEESTALTYEGAKEFCRKEGAYLITIHSSADLKKIAVVMCAC
ncbi:hypothetical protein COOONC_01898 [Cooperia oncophora]